MVGLRGRAVRGHIRRRGSRWYIQLYLGRDEATGRKRYLQKACPGTRKDAERELARLINELEGGNYVEPTRLTLGDYLRQWLAEYAAPRTRQRTAVGYREIAERYVIPELGPLRLDRLSAAHIEHYENKMLREGAKKGGGLSPTTVRNHHRLLNAVLKRAVRQGLVGRNVVELADSPIASTYEARALTFEEVTRYLEAAQDSWAYEILALSIDTGLRRSELLALDWGHVDLEVGALSVVRSLHENRNKAGDFYFEPPKTKRSRRVVPLPQSARLLLLAFRERKEAENEALGRPMPSADALVFSDLDGGPIHPGRVSRVHHRVAKAAGLESVRLHDLRHTYVTLMLASGVDLRVAAGLVGHASVSITGDRYAHPAREMEVKAVERFSEARNAKGMPSEAT